MKKIIFSFINLCVVNLFVFNVISCSPKNNYDVILEFPTDSPGSSVVKAYENVVNQFNQDYPQSPFKLKLLVTPLNSIKDKIATRTSLPNLYIAYPDPIANYDMLLKLRDQESSIVNMAEVINWQFDNESSWWEQEEVQWLNAYLDNANKINQELMGNESLNEVLINILGEPISYRPFINSFLNESLVPGTITDSIFMYSAPLVKSTYMGVVNLRLLNELIVKVLGEDKGLQLINYDIREPYFIKESNNKKLKNIQINSLENPYRLSKMNRYLNDETLTFGDFLEPFHEAKTPEALQRLLGDLSNIEILLAIYWNLVGNQKDNTQDQWIKTLSYGVDDVFAMTGLMQGQLTGDFQQFTSWDPNNPYNLIVNTKDSQLHEGLNHFLNFIQWGNDYKGLLADGSNVPDHGNGGLGIKANGVKDYYSSQWVNQGMLFYYCSSAAIKYMMGNKENQVHHEDILLAPIPVYKNWTNETNWSLLYRQQARGIAMFKDQNVIKNQVAIAFLNYFLSPEINNQFAIDSGYIPTNYYAYYNSNRPIKNLPDENSLYYQELLKENSLIKGSLLIKSLIDQLATQDIKMWITQPSPFGEIVNLQLTQPWFQKYYKTFFDNGPKSENLTWEQFEKDFQKEATRVVNSMLPGISHVFWNGSRND